MKFYIGNTDYDWYRHLHETQPTEVNFWRPGGTTRFRVLSQGFPFLFRLTAPINKVAGVGFFVSHTFLPLSIAWEVFGSANGSNSHESLRRLIFRHRSARPDEFDPTIGCIILTNPIFFDEHDWLPVPSDWASGIQQGKSYQSSEGIGRQYWQEIEALIQLYQSNTPPLEPKDRYAISEPVPPSYRSVLAKVRLGQASFRALVTDAYQRRCSITGERALPALEASHIKPYADSGPNQVNNGLLLRSDVHRLFDAGYLTVSSDYHVEVSNRIREEYENGREYYKYHGQQLSVLPPTPIEAPSQEFIDYHNNKVYRG